MSYTERTSSSSRPSQVIRGDEAGLAIGQVAAAALAKIYKRGMSQTDHYHVTVDKKFGIDGVAVTGGDAIPQVEKSAFVGVSGQLGSHFKGATNSFMAPALANTGRVVTRSPISVILLLIVR